MAHDMSLGVNVVCHIDQSNLPLTIVLHPPSSPWLQTPTYKVRRLKVSVPLYLVVKLIEVCAL